MRRELLTFIALWSTALMAAAQPSRDVFLFGEGDMSTTFNWEVQRKRYDGLPQWRPSAGPPPFPMAKAVEIGNAWLRKRHPDVRQFDVSSVALVRAGCCIAADERWFYRIDFQPVLAGQRMLGGRFVAVVLLDGSIIEPRAQTRERR